MVVTSARRLASLVNDILDFSRLENRDLDLDKKAVDLRGLTDIQANHQQMLQVALNLINNAAQALNDKYPPRMRTKSSVSGQKGCKRRAAPWCGSPSTTRARASPPACWSRSRRPSSPPSRRAKAPAWASASPRASSPTTAAPCASRASKASLPP